MRGFPEAHRGGALGGHGVAASPRRCGQAAGAGRSQGPGHPGGHRLSDRFAAPVPGKAGHIRLGLPGRRSGAGRHHPEGHAGALLRHVFGSGSEGGGVYLLGRGAIFGDKASGAAAGARRAGLLRRTGRPRGLRRERSAAGALGGLRRAAGEGRRAGVRGAATGCRGGTGRYRRAAADPEWCSSGLRLIPQRTGVRGGAGWGVSPAGAAPEPAAGREPQFEFA